MTSTTEHADGLVKRLLKKPVLNAYTSPLVPRAKEKASKQTSNFHQTHQQESKKFTAINPFGYEQDKLESLLIGLISEA